MKKHAWIILAAVLLTAAAMALFLLFTPWGRAALAWAGAGETPDSSAAPAVVPAPSAPPSASAPSKEAGAVFWQDSVYLDVELITQTPELPNGCEATSLAMMLKYLGFEADKTALAYDYIPRQDFEYTTFAAIGGDPEAVYAGDPATDMGFYCFAAPVAAGANRYLEEQASPLRAMDITGADESQLVEHLLAGRPVMLWETLYCLPAEVREDLAWVLNDTGTAYVPYINLHVVVLCGFDADYFYLCDPYGLTARLERSALMASYAEMGSRALVIVEE